MIDQIVTDIAAQVTAKLPFVKGVKQIARQDPTGIITKEGPEEWAGIDDAEDGRLYIRFRDGWDRLFTDGRMISGENLQVTDRMRGVFMHYCENEHEIARALTFGILHSVNHSLRYHVRLRTSSTDRQYIYKQETRREEGMKDDRLRLIMIDFDITYRDTMELTPECLPICRVC